MMNRSSQKYYFFYLFLYCWGYLQSLKCHQKLTLVFTVKEIRPFHFPFNIKLTRQATLEHNLSYVYIDCLFVGQQCPDPGTPGGAVQVATSYDIGSELRYECTRPGFVISGPSPYTCQFTGTAAVWSDNLAANLPTCQGENGSVFMFDKILILKFRWVEMFSFILYCHFSHHIFPLVKISHTKQWFIIK